VAHAWRLLSCPSIPLLSSLEALPAMLALCLGGEKAGKRGGPSLACIPAPPLLRASETLASFDSLIKCLLIFPSPSLKCVPIPPPHTDLPAPLFSFSFASARTAHSPQTPPMRAYEGGGGWILPQMPYPRLSDTNERSLFLPHVYFSVSLPLPSPRSGTHCTFPHTQVDPLLNSFLRPPECFTAQQCLWFE